jgi:hypothetical protein
MPYTSTGYNKFLTKDGYPAISPPWGTLNAIDLNTGKISLENHPLVDTEELKEKGIPYWNRKLRRTYCYSRRLGFHSRNQRWDVPCLQQKNWSLTCGKQNFHIPAFATPCYLYRRRQTIYCYCLWWWKIRCSFR